MILVKSELSKAKPGDVGKTLGDSVIVDHTTGVRFRNILMEQDAER